MDLSLVFASLEIVVQPCFILTGNDVLYTNPALLKELGLSSINNISQIFESNSLTDIAKVQLKNGKSAKLNVKDLGNKVRIVCLSISGNSLEILHNQRLTTLGTIAGGVAHDFNNILAGILGHTSFLKSLLEDNTKAQESLSAIEEVGKRAGYMVKEIGTFSRQKVSNEVQKLSLNEKVKLVCHLLRPSVAGNIKLDYTLPDEEHTVVAVQGRLTQVFLNVLMNSIDACTEGGEISITLKSAGTVNGKHYSEVAVQDNGVGMSPAVIGNAFDPFYTNGKKYGTGFGLHIVKSVIDALDGKVEIISEPGAGTTVKITIPSEMEVKRTITVSDNLERGTEKILVVDDEDAVRNVVGLSLQHLGYQITMAESGRTALGILEQDPNYDLVLLDMLMPKMSGEQVFDKLKVLYPEIKVLIMSGFTSEASVNKILSEGGKGFLPKPFTIQQLSIAIRKCFK